MQIFHGDNQIASRQAFLDKKSQTQKNFTVIDLPGDNLTLSDLKNAVETSSLFGNNTSVFVEGFFSRRPSNEKKAIVEYLKSKPNANIFLWDSKDVSSQLTTHNQQLITKFDLPKLVFQFLDNWQASTYRAALATVDAEPIMALLAKRIQDLILVHENAFSGPSWQQGKLSAQAKQYSNSQLSIFNSQLLELDFKNKNGLLPYHLAAALELWLIKNVK